MQQIDFVWRYFVLIEFQIWVSDPKRFARRLAIAPEYVSNLQVVRLIYLRRHSQLLAIEYPIQLWE